ncbi:hypothetical protein A9Q99_15050 [Gammaproteobacteria bacterium 45_16_T64]|nr:hypothetical protein A9Q99_15050 [Gammaproteobacteria bacterium 45_16_T64]
MRLTPIESPTSPLLWLAYKLTERGIGTVITPLKTIYARKPALLPLLDKVTRYQSSTLTIDSNIKLLIKAYGSLLNGCDFCHDIALAEVIRNKLGEEKFLRLGQWAQDPQHYSPEEQAVLSFVLDYHQHHATSDVVYDTLCQHFSETQIIDIVSINAIEQYYNAMNKPFNLIADGLANSARAQSPDNSRLPA